MPYRLVEQMKIARCIFLFLAASVIAGCSTTITSKFTEWPNSSIVQGKGGVVHRVDDVDFWESGEPNRKYHILGSARDDEGWIWTSLDTIRRNEARFVKQHGGNAAIVSKEREWAGKHRNGTVTYRWITKLVIAKYVE
jgi:hypothetical protein